MGPKRGNPSSLDSNDPAIIRRRQLAAERARRFRARRVAQTVERVQPTSTQLQQGERIIDLGFTDEDAAETLTQLGLRVQGITLAIDPRDAQLQTNATPVYEHEDLYRETSNPNYRNTSTDQQDIFRHYYPSEATSQQTNISSFFRTHPPANPFVNYTTPRARPANTSSTIPQPEPSVQPQSQVVDLNKSLETIEGGKRTIASYFRLPALTSPVADTTPPASSHNSIHILPNTETTTTPQEQNKQLDQAQEGDREKEATPINTIHEDINDILDNASNISLSDLPFMTQEEFMAQDNNTALSSLQPINLTQDNIFEQEVDRVLLAQPEDILRLLSPSNPPSPDHQSDDPQPAQGSTPNSEQSFNEFQSHQSDRSIHTDQSEEQSDLDFIADKLFDQLQRGHYGCDADSHDAERIQHNGEVNTHHGLNEIFNDPEFPSVLGSQSFLSPERLGQQDAISVDQWTQTFCGTSNNCSTPQYICLHTEETKAIPPQVAFDVDSFLGFASSLTFARQGIIYQPIPLEKQNIQTDIHIQSFVATDGDNQDNTPNVRPTALQYVPHFQFGRVIGASEISIYLLFPHLAVRGEKFFALTQDQYRRWTDKILNPAIYEFCQAHYTQHLPASFRHALYNSRAHQTESRLTKTGAYQTQLMIGYPLQVEYLDAIWEKILHIINETPGLGDFREPQIFFAAKGTKLQFKTTPSRPTLHDAMGQFQEYIQRILDFDYVYQDRFYVDIGKEVCPEVSRLIEDEMDIESEAQVYLWRKCCQEAYLHWMYDNEPPSKTGTGRRYYNLNMLGESTSLTSLTAHKSRHRKGGLIYSQFYSSVKEIWDAAKCIPFMNDGLEELALDPSIQVAARKLAGGGSRDIHVLETAYWASKRRAHRGLLDSRQKSFGLREEHRVSWPLYQAIQLRLRAYSPEELVIQLDDVPTYTWAVKTETYLNFLWRSANKFATGFEVVRAQYGRDFVTWEQTKLMAMFLRCLRFVFGAHQFSRESALWWSRRDADDEGTRKLWYGLGFSNTLEKYQYCWIEPRVDWDNHRFLPEITEHVLFGNSVLRRQYLRKGGQLYDFFALSYQIDLAILWIREHRHHPIIRNRMMEWMVHICLRQLRRDILKAIAPEIKEEYRKKALDGDISFCHDSLSEILIDNIYLISGNRCDFKQVKKLAKFLFDFNDGKTRAHWDDRPFRKLYQRVLTGLGPQQVNGQQKFFRHLVQDNLCYYHWILPYPCPEVLTQKTKGGDRMWYSIKYMPDPDDEEDVAPPDDTIVDDWQWAKKDFIAGQPPPIPEFVTWDREDWDKWIQETLQIPVPQNGGAD